MGSYKKWMLWGPDKIGPKDILEVLKTAGADSHKVTKKFKAEWTALSKQLAEDSLAPEIFAKQVTPLIWKYYFAEAYANKTGGIPTISKAALKQKKLKFTAMNFASGNTAELESWFDKTTATAFKSAAAGSGGRGILSDGPKESLGGSVPALDHVRLGSGGASDRLWFNKSGKVIYAVSGHVDTSSNGKKEHDKLVKKVNKIGSGKKAYAYCDLPDFNGELFLVGN